VTDRITNPWGEGTPFPREAEWPARADQYLEEGVSEDEVDRWVRSASILHSNGDALDIAVKDGRIVGVRGRTVDRVNKGRLDPKDLYGWQANNSEDRLTKPLVREDGGIVEASWEEAMGRIVARSKALLRDKGPLSNTTGRTLYHFHTRTKTARAPQLNDAAPEVRVEMHPSDAYRLGISEGDLVSVQSPRGGLEARARISGIREGVIFVPFHCGYFDEDDGHRRAANELTITQWDPVCKQPVFKTAVVRVTKVAGADGTPSPAPTITASAPVEAAGTTGGRG
jgi:predicted molibdopterin-dependent oxidoreductase YjgC